MLRHSLFLMTAIVAATSLMCVSAKDIPADNDARKKARYYFLQAVGQDALSKYDNSFELYKKAYQTDSTYLEAGFHYALLGLLHGTLTDDAASEAPVAVQSNFSYLDSIAADTLIIDDALALQTPDPRYELMHRYVDAYPGDLYNMMYYANILAQTGYKHEGAVVMKRACDLNPNRSELLLALSQLQLEADMLDEYLNTMNRYEQLEGPSPELSFRKVASFVIPDIPDTLKILAEADSLIAKRPNDNRSYLFKGTMLDYLGRNDEAIKYYKHAESLSPENGNVKMSIANHYKTIGDSITYDKYLYDAMLSEDLEIAKKLEVLADYMRSLVTNNSDKARGYHLVNALKMQYPHDPNILYLAAQYESAVEDYDLALADLKYAIDLEPNTPDFRERQIMLLYLNDDVDEIRKAYDEAAKYNAVTDGMKEILGNSLINHKQYQEALDFIEQQLKEINPSLELATPCINPSVLADMSYADLNLLTNLYIVAGSAYHFLNMPKECFQAYENGKGCYMDEPLLFNNYAYAIADMGGDLNYAEELAQKALNEEPGNPTYLDTYAWVLYKQGRYDDAKFHQSAAIELGEDKKDITAELYEHYAEILLKTGDTAMANKYFKMAEDLKRAEEENTKK